MTAVITTDTGIVSQMDTPDDDAVEAAIALELAARVELYGGLNAYARDFGVDKRNFARYLRGDRTPTLPQLMKHLGNLSVGYAEFFASVDERLRGNH